MDKIFICDLKVNTIIGVYPQERERRQQLTINLELSTDLSAAALSDRLEDTVNYAEIEERVTALVSASHFLLIEGLAGAIGRLLLEYCAVQSARVRIEKPAAARHARAIAVELEFKR